MFVILCLLCVGIGMGYLFRHIHSLKRLENTISYTIFVMLFVFGVTIGANKTLVDNIGNFGLQAALLAVCGVLGSLLASYLAFKVLSGKGGNDEK